MLLFQIGSTDTAQRLFNASPDAIATFEQFLTAVNACRGFWANDSSGPPTTFVKSLLGSIQGTFWSLPKMVVDRTADQLKVWTARLSRAVTRCAAPNCTASHCIAPLASTRCVCCPCLCQHATSSHATHCAAPYRATLHHAASACISGGRRHHLCSSSPSLQQHNHTPTSTRPLHTCPTCPPPHHHQSSDNPPAPTPQPLLSLLAQLLRAYITAPANTRVLSKLLDALVEALDRLDEVDVRYCSALCHERLPELLVQVLQEYSSSDVASRWVAWAGGWAGGWALGWALGAGRCVNW
jgi:hypothetical protein